MIITAESDDLLVETDGGTATLTECEGQTWTSCGARVPASPPRQPRSPVSTIEHLANIGFLEQRHSRVAGVPRYLLARVAGGSREWPVDQSQQSFTVPGAGVTDAKHPTEDFR